MPIAKKPVKKVKSPAAKTAALKTSTKKATATKKNDKKITAKAPARSLPKRAGSKSNLTIDSAFTKTQIINYLASTTDIKRKDVIALLDAMTQLFKSHLSKNGPKEINFAGLFKCLLIHKPATKARNGINPFTNQPTVFPAKPARNVLKIRPLKKMKELVG